MLAEKSINHAFTKINLIAAIFFTQIDYIVPLLILLVCLSTHSPAYTLLRSIYNFEQDGRLFAAIIQTASGLMLSFSGLVALSGWALCIIITGFGLVVLYLWTLFIHPQGDEVKAGKILVGPYFSNRILIHNSLKILTLLHEELCRGFIFHCLHHSCTVALSSVALYYILVSFSKGGHSAVLVVSASIIIMGAMTLIELFAIYFISNAVTASKQFLHRMSYIYGRHKYASRVVKALLPNSMNIEFLNSLSTLVNGIEMNYFLNYLERVTNTGIALLFTGK